MCTQITVHTELCTIKDPALHNTVELPKLMFQHLVLFFMKFSGQVSYISYGNELHLTSFLLFYLSG